MTSILASISILALIALGAIVSTSEKKREERDARERALPPLTPTYDGPCPNCGYHITMLEARP